MIGSYLLKIGIVTALAVCATVELCDASTATGPTCQSAFTTPLFAGHEGRLEHPGLMLLGSGGTGSVYRRISAPKPTIVKVYKDPKGIEMNLFGLSELAAITSGLSHAVKVIRVLEVHENSVVFADVFGRTVQDVFENKLLNPVDTEKLLTKYLLARTQIENALAAKFGSGLRNWNTNDPTRLNSAAHVTYWQAVTGREQSVRVHIYLKPDNVIVDPKTLELTIIDPF